MGKQNTFSKSKKTSEGGIGKGKKVTPVQVAFIVDRYLSDNHFVQTRSTFRNEASHLISKSPVNEAPKSLLSLGDMLEEYISLKEHKLVLNQEKTRLDNDKFRLQTLLRGMQHVINNYTCSSSAPLPSIVMPPAAAAAANFPAYNNTPVMMSLSRPSNSRLEHETPPTMLTQQSLKKRKNTKDVSAAPLASKRSRTQSSANQLYSSSSVTTKPAFQPSNNQSTLQITPVPSTSHVHAPVKVSPVQGSSVAKCLFNAAGPQTPSPCTTDKSVSPPVNHTPLSGNTKTITPPHQFTSTKRTVITSETIQVSPMKQVSYYSIERNHSISSPMKTTSKRFGTREHVKGRLDFDGSEMTAAAAAAVSSDILTSDENTGSPSEDVAFDFDLPNLDCLADFNLTDLLGDFDLDGKQRNYFCQTDNGSSPESTSGSPDTTVDGIAGDHELLSGMSSTVTEIRSEQDMNAPGPNSVTSVKCVTKCIKVFSPVKIRKTTGSDYEICDADQVV